MHINQQIYRELWTMLLSDKSDKEYDELILPWLKNAALEKTWLAEFAARPENPYPNAEIEDLWRLYALSRVNDVCILRFQPRIDPEASQNTKWDGPNITVEQYAQMFETLGLRVVDRSTFHPFFHEIVAIEQADNPDEAITITQVKWPCLMLGNMMFSRAGVEVRGGRNHIRQEIAQTSTMYWTYWRKYRKYQDLSQGWGSNSQWRTPFRRDYFMDQHYFYNVDVEPYRKINLSSETVVFDASRVENASRLERIELVRNRCFIYAEIRPDNDLWPYDDFFQEQV